MRKPVPQVEFERRFRLSSLPEDLNGPSLILRQVYWNLGGGWLLRLRRTGDAHQLDDELAIKGPRHGHERVELEFPLNQANSRPGLGELAKIAAELYNVGKANQVVKTRHSHLDSLGQTWDIDEFHFANSGLFIAEIEGRSAEEVAAVKPPPWSVEEVTLDARYNNEHLAVRPYTTW